jgi:hypothetical protein
VPVDVQGVQAWDRYAYVNNNPVRFNDPSGHCIILCTAIVGGAIGAIVGAVGYTAYAAVTGTEFNTSHMLIAAGGGAAAGALIGTGVGIVAGMSTAAATSAAVTGGTAAATATTTVMTAMGGDPTDELRGISQAYGNLAHAARYGIQAANHLQRTLAKTGLQAHHLVEQRFEKALNMSLKNSPAVAVTPKEHQMFTNAWRSAIGYSNSTNSVNTLTANVDDIWKAAQDIYHNHPLLLNATKQLLEIR